MAIVHVRKYGDLIPVQLREPGAEAHLDELAAAHGESSIVLEDGRTLNEVRQPERDRLEQEAAEAAEAERLQIEGANPEIEEQVSDQPSESSEGSESQPAAPAAVPAKKSAAKKSSRKKGGGK